MLENVTELRVVLSDLFLKMYEYGDPIKYLKEAGKTISPTEEKELRRNFAEFVKEFKKRMH